MAEKVKVSREVARVLDEVRGCHEPTIDDFIERHAKGDVGRDWEALKQYRTLFVAHLIYTGDYEIEQTPEEKILATFQRQFTQCDTSDICDNRVRTAYANAIVYTLDTLGIKIKGINK